MKFAGEEDKRGEDKDESTKASDQPVIGWSLTQAVKLFLQIVHEHLCDLGAGGLSSRVEDAAALAVDDAVLDSPAQSVQSVTANLIGIIKMEFFVGGGGFSGIAPKYDRQLLTSDIIAGTEQPVTVARDDAALCRPSHSPGVPSIGGYIGESSGEGLAGVVL